MESPSGGFWIAGWKQIARYCGRSIRTCKTYHYQFCMPVLRGPGNTPIAFPALLDEWLVTLHYTRKKLKEERAESAQEVGNMSEVGQQKTTKERDKPHEATKT